MIGDRLPQVIGLVGESAQPRPGPDHPVVIGDQVAGDGEEPHPQAGQLGVESVGRPPGAEKGLLHDVLSRSFVPGRTQRKPIELTDVRVVGLSQVSLIGQRRRSVLRAVPDVTSRSPISLPARVTSIRPGCGYGRAGRNVQQQRAAGRRFGKPAQALLGSVLHSQPDERRPQYVRTHGWLSVALTGTNFGVDFNPAADRLRVISDTGQNLRHDLTAGTTTVDGLTYPPATTPATGVTGAAYTNNGRPRTGPGPEDVPALLDLHRELLSSANHPGGGDARA